jgi:hypothetical protein
VVAQTAAAGGESDFQLINAAWAKRSRRVREPDRVMAALKQQLDLAIGPLLPQPLSPLDLAMGRMDEGGDLVRAFIGEPQPFGTPFGTPLGAPFLVASQPQRTHLFDAPFFAQADEAEADAQAEAQAEAETFPFSFSSPRPRGQAVRAPSEDALLGDAPLISISFASDDDGGPSGR